MTYYANVFRDRPRIAPSDPVPALGVLADPGKPMSIVGIAFVAGRLGGMDPARPHDDYAPPEAVRRLILDRAWVDGKVVKLAEPVALDGRYALRRGVFVGISEEAE